MGVRWDRSLSLTSAVFRTTRAAGISDIVALAALTLLFVAIVGGLIAIARHNGVHLFSAREILFARQRRRSETLEWAALIFVALASSPQTTARHMILMLLIYTVAIAVFLAQKAAGPKILLAVATTLMTASLSLPPGGRALDHWRSISAASWCAMLLTMAIVWTGTRAISISEAANSGGRQERSRGSD